MIRCWSISKPKVDINSLIFSYESLPHASTKAILADRINEDQESETCGSRELCGVKSAIKKI